MRKVKSTLRRRGAVKVCALVAWQDPQWREEVDRQQRKSLSQEKKLLSCTRALQHVECTDSLFRGVKYCTTNSKILSILRALRDKKSCCN